jgi:anti-sigma regulatory factor (Ser/Thr protein kinase)/ActR/RegA family two-component response regulator
MYRVLLISPGADLKEWARSAWATPDLAFEVAAGSADALRCLRRRPYDAVLSSPCSAVEEDLALLEEMRHLRPAVKTIVLAPHATSENVIAALRAHVFALFSAPFEPAEILGMLKRAVGETDSRHGIEVVSAQRAWISVRLDCRLVTAERLVQILSALPTELTESEHDDLMLAFREILLNAIEHGAGFDPHKMVEVSAVRTERAHVFYVRDPGPGFRPSEVPHAAIANPPDDPVAHVERRAAEGMRPGGFGILLAKKIVDEMIYSERGNEVVLIKHIR